MSQFLQYVFKECGEPLKIMAADTATAKGAAAKSKLARFLEPDDDVEELGIGATLQSIRSDQDAALNYWERLGEGLSEGNLLVDVGANVLPGIWEWATETNAGRILRTAPPIWLIIPVTAQAQSLVDACDLIRLAEAKQEHLPIAKYIVVFNEHEGKFDGIRDALEYKELAKLIAAVKAGSVRMERCKSSVWQRMQAEYISLKTMRSLTYHDYATRFALSAFKSSAAEKDFVEWMYLTTKALLPALTSQRT